MMNGLEKVREFEERCRRKPESITRTDLDDVISNLTSALDDGIERFFLVQGSPKPPGFMRGLCRAVVRLNARRWEHRGNQFTQAQSPRRAADCYFTAVFPYAAIGDEKTALRVKTKFDSVYGSSHDPTTREQWPRMKRMIFEPLNYRIDDVTTPRKVLIQYFGSHPLYNMLAKEFCQTISKMRYC